VAAKKMKVSQELLYGLLFLFIAPCMLTACQGKESYRKQLAQRGTAFSPDSFMVQVSRGDKETVALFVKAGMDLNARDQKGWTALMIASLQGFTDLARYLIDKGADVNARNTDGYTALMEAVYKGHSETVRLLIEKRADVNARSDGGLTSLMIASAVGRADIAEALRKAGARE